MHGSYLTRYWSFRVDVLQTHLQLGSISPFPSQHTLDVPDWCSTSFWMDCRPDVEAGKVCRGNLPPPSAVVLIEDADLHTSVCRRMLRHRAPQGGSDRTNAMQTLMQGFQAK